MQKFGFFVSLDPSQPMLLKERTPRSDVPLYFNYVAQEPRAETDVAVYIGDYISQRSAMAGVRHLESCRQVELAYDALLQDLLGPNYRDMADEIFVDMPEPSTDEIVDWQMEANGDIHRYFEISGYERCKKLGPDYVPLSPEFFQNSAVGRWFDMSGPIPQCCVKNTRMDLSRLQRGSSLRQVVGFDSLEESLDRARSKKSTIQMTPTERVETDEMVGKTWHTNLSMLERLNLQSPEIQTEILETDPAHLIFNRHVTDQMARKLADVSGAMDEEHRRRNGDGEGFIASIQNAFRNRRDYALWRIISSPLFMTLVFYIVKLVAKLYFCGLSPKQWGAWFQEIGGQIDSDLNNFADTLKAGWKIITDGKVNLLKLGSLMSNTPNENFSPSEISAIRRLNESGWINPETAMVVGGSFLGLAALSSVVLPVIGLGTVGVGALMTMGGGGAMVSAGSLMSGASSVTGLIGIAMPMLLAIAKSTLMSMVLGAIITSLMAYLRGFAEHSEGLLSHLAGLMETALRKGYVIAGISFAAEVFACRRIQNSIPDMQKSIPRLEGDIEDAQRQIAELRKKVTENLDEASWSNRVWNWGPGGKNLDVDKLKDQAAVWGSEIPRLENSITASRNQIKTTTDRLANLGVSVAPMGPQTMRFKPGTSVTPLVPNATEHNGWLGDKWKAVVAKVSEMRKRLLDLVPGSRKYLKATTQIAHEMAQDPEWNSRLFPGS